MHSDYKLPTVEFIDPIISAEIRDKIEDPELYSLVNKFMIHGPCGAENINCPCMVEKKYPSVVRLLFHLPNQHQIVYGEDDDINDVLDKSSIAASKFTSWMECNSINSEAQELIYVEFPTKFVWKLNVKGPTSFDELRTVNGETHSSFRDACYALGLLDDDKEYIDRPFGKIQGNIWRMEFYITNDKDLSLTKDELKNLTLFEIEQILIRNNSTLKKFTKMPYPDVELVSSSNNQLITEELDYDIPVIKNEFDRMFLALTKEQRHIFLDIMSVVKENKGGVFFVYGYGGTDGELASLLRKASLIIRDEAPMVHKHAFEALDRTLKDVLRCENSTISNIPFGGKVTVFGVVAEPGSK
ncbi:unnamed protein product [Lactuca virosa]|uniref:ATP-dependent DNA helicase n=1 Tax=Lactuca virosa TaxID=75947 RepID=A0AAU9N654_9ASTR|nr:unnamed protein product [Lactuca virosa]